MCDSAAHTFVVCVYKLNAVLGSFVYFLFFCRTGMNDHVYVSVRLNRGADVALGQAKKQGEENCTQQ